MLFMYIITDLCRNTSVVWVTHQLSQKVWLAVEIPKCGYARIIIYRFKLVTVEQVQ